LAQLIIWEGYMYFFYFFFERMFWWDISENYFFCFRSVLYLDCLLIFLFWEKTKDKNAGILTRSIFYIQLIVLNLCKKWRTILARLTNFFTQPANRTRTQHKIRKLGLRGLTCLNKWIGLRFTYITNLIHCIHVSTRSKPDTKLVN